MFWPNSEKQPWCSKYGLKKREKKYYLNDFFCHGLYFFKKKKKNCLQVNPKFVQLIFNSCNFLTGFFFFDYIILILSNLFFKKNKPMKNSLSNENLCYFFIFLFFFGNLVVVFKPCTRHHSGCGIRISGAFAVEICHTI